MHHAFVSAASPVTLRQRGANSRPQTPRTPTTTTATAASPPARTLWTPDSWRERNALQQPLYDDAAALKVVEQRLSVSPPLVFPGETDRLRARLADAAAGNAFVLQGGDCAESFSHFSTESVESTFRALVAMSVAISYVSGLRVVKLGRIAGQFAKPRSSNFEKGPDGVELPSFRGDIINSPEADMSARIPDPERIIRAYSQSASSLNMVRALAKSSSSMLEWVDLVDRLAPPAYAHYVDGIRDALAFTAACGLDSGASTEMREPEFYSSHEALLLPYEQALTRSRINPVSGDTEYYCASAHMLWVGERTRQLDGAHVEYLRGVRNCLGAKVGPTMTADDLLRLIDILNPDNEPGRLTLIVRMGADKIADILPPLVRAVRDAGRVVVWSIDAMHGNTIKVDSGLKTRPFSAILSEIDTFFKVLAAESCYGSGVHLEMTGDEHVTECLGGAVSGITEAMLANNFQSACDPRLNGSQAVEMAFEVGFRVRKRTK
jgi:3-deoxy-7-phosphoheptulonate synthase